jgi:ABC-2 type transport system permease protein
MFAEFKHSLRRFRGQIIGWWIGVGLYGLLMAYFYGTIAKIEGLQQLLESYPQEMLAFFGEITKINTPMGYLDTYYFSYMTMIIGIFAIGACASLLVGDEEKGILDLVMSQPISRSELYWGRVLGFIAAVLLVLLVGWLSWLIPSGSSGMDLSWIEFLRPFVPLFAILVLFGLLALFMSLILPSTRFAGMLSGGLLVANFLLIGLARINDTLEPIVRLTPLNYYQGGNAAEGLNWEWLAGLLGAALIFGLLGWLLFQRRDIRVGGESGWGLSFLRRKQKHIAAP